MLIQNLSLDQLEIYSAIPISFMVNSILSVAPIDDGLGGIRLTEQPVSQPWVKNYDAEETPLDWEKQFDLANWGIFIAYEESQPVGGAAVALNTPKVNMLEDRKDLAVLWDIRVLPDRRGMGIGKALFLHSADWARRQGCSQLKIETQNINVPACKFYCSMGCELGMIHRYGYAAIPAVADEAMLFWYYKLS